MGLQYVTSDFVQIPPRRAVFCGQKGCFDGHLETQEKGAEQHCLMRKVPFRGTLAGDHMLRDKACTLLSYQGVGV